MKRQQGFLLTVFVIFCLLLSSCVAPRFTHGKHYSNARVRIQVDKKQETTTAKSFPIEEKQESPVPVQSSESLNSSLTVDSTDETTVAKIEPGKVTTRADKKETGFRKIERSFLKRLLRNDETLKNTEANRSVVWLAYGITSLVLGVLSIAMVPLSIFVHTIIFCVLGMAMGILALIFGIMGLKAKRLKFLAILGMVLGIIAIILWIILIILFAVGILTLI